MMEGKAVLIGRNGNGEVDMVVTYIIYPDIQLVAGKGSDIYIVDLVVARTLFRCGITANELLAKQFFTIITQVSFNALTNTFYALPTVLAGDIITLGISANAIGANLSCFADFVLAFVLIAGHIGSEAKGRDGEEYGEIYLSKCSHKGNLY